MIKRVLTISGWVAFAVFIILTLAFSANETANIDCHEIAVNYSGNSPVRLSRQEVVRLIKKADQKLIGKKLNEINAEAIEAELEKHKTIRNAHVYKLVTRDSTSYKGVLAVKVRHREPVLRVISSKGNYFMDANGAQIPVSPNYAAKVPVITGNVSEETAQNEMLDLVMYLRGERFWNSQIKQIHINGNGELLITTLVGDQIIEFGKPENYKIKLRNLKAFYEQVMAQNNWARYARINLKYDDQVIAKKRK